jgi:hypothetical protein
MSITIENPTAEAIISEIKRQIPASEFERLKALLIQEKPYWEDPAYSSEWSEEDLADATRSTGLLIEKRFGPETVDYD